MTQKNGLYDDRMARLFGQRIVDLRKGKGWRQMDLAERCGLGRQYISTVESGKRKVSLETAKVLSRALQVGLGELVDGL